MYFHESNIIGKINSNDYEDIREELIIFYDEEYLKYKEQLDLLDFSSKEKEVFEVAARLIDEYLVKIESFQKEYKISSQSKFRSSFLEEISTYLFKDLSLIKSGNFGIYNKNIFAGMKIKNQMQIDTLTKDVDFCVGKEAELKVDETQTLTIIVPIVCVEVKKYLDAYMFGEAQHSSMKIKNASPNVKTYVLMEFNSVAKEKIFAARYDNILNEMFRLRRGSRKTPIIDSPLNPEALLEYYEEISIAIENAEIDEDNINDIGKLLDR